MTKELTKRQAAKRERITQAARSLFLSGGYLGTSMDAITAGAGVSKQTLYAYFPSKLDLFTSIVTDQLAQFSPEPPANVRLASVNDLRELMVGFAVTLTEQMMASDMIALLRLLLGEAPQVAEVRELVRDALPGRLLSRTEHLLIQAQAAGLITVPHPNLSARMFVGPLMSYVILDGVLGAPESARPDRATLELLVDAFSASVTR